MFSAPLEVLRALPDSVDLTPSFAPYDQGHIGECTANALAGAEQFDRLKNAQAPDFVRSRLFIYYNERVIESDPASDAGAMIWDGIKSLQQQGVCPETEWPYDDTPALYEGGPFPVGSKPATQPPQICYNDAVTMSSRATSGSVRRSASCKAASPQGFRSSLALRSSTDGTARIRDRP
jgi:C1A family cysteine protease